MTCLFAFSEIVRFRLFAFLSRSFVLKMSQEDLLSCLVWFFKPFISCQRLKKEETE